MPVSSPAAALWMCAAGLGVALVATGFVGLFDRRRLNGESVWAKPMKFELSLGIHFLTLALLSARLSDPVRSGRVWAWTAGAAIVAAAFEVIYIGWRASRQERSHFNVSTPLAAFMYGLMGVGAVVLTGAAGVVAGLILSDAHFRGGDGLRWGAILGLGLGTGLTFVTAFAMGGGLSRHVGQEAADARRMPVTGWSLTVGDRRPAHFLATHMMQALPVAGLAADRILPSPVAVPFVYTVAILMAAATLALFFRAGRGLPLFTAARTSESG